MKDFLKKLKSGRGAVGVDVLTSSAMILITVTIVSILYVNISLQTRNIQRTAGATRIATNILENIQSMSYEEFTTLYDGIMVTDIYNGETYHKVEGTETNYKVFGTKIPVGYAFYIKAENVYGSHTIPTEQFDLVRDIDIVVTYKLGNNVEDISFSTIKQRELIDECNAPNTSYLNSVNSISTEAKIYPIKYSEVIGGYIRTTEDDVDWYDYNNKKWAVVLVSDKLESDLFDANGRYTGVEAPKYMWIPAFFVNLNDVGNEFKAFRYKGSEKIIIPNVLTSLADVTGETSLFNYYSFAEKPAEYQKLTEDTYTGMWVEMSESSLNSVQQASILNNSAYGPFIIH